MLHNAIRETHPSPFFILLLIFKTLLTYFYTRVYTEVRENLAKLVFSFQHVGSMDQAQVTWFGGTHFYPLSHPSGPISYLIFIKPVLFLFMCMYVYVSTCAGIHSSQKGALGGALGPLELESQVVVRHLTWVLNSIWSSLHEQYMPLTSEPYLYLQNCPPHVASIGGSLPRQSIL